MSDSYRILFFGDIVGELGRDLLQQKISGFRQQYRPEFVIVNGENAAGGLGITPKIADQIFAWGVDAITLGNHAFNKREIASYLDSEPNIIRPINFSSRLPGHGTTLLERDGVYLTVANIAGRVSMEPAYDDPFMAADRILESADGHVFIDFHAEATSEKIAMGWHCDGRATAVVGTHTHVPTADQRVLPGGTAYITDVGMCGPRDGVLGMDREIILRRFRGDLPERFEVAKGPGVICGVSLDVQKETGRALRIERIHVGM
jgi:metallophosphoesterase (TIGR00282 family)